MFGLALTASHETRNFRLIYISKLTSEYLLKDPFIHDFHDVSFEKWIRPPVHSKSQDYARQVPRLTSEVISWEWVVGT